MAKEYPVIGGPRHGELHDNEWAFGRYRFTGELFYWDTGEVTTIGDLALLLDANDTIERIMRMCRQMSQEERERLLDAYRGEFCIYCGGPGPGCYCMRDC